MSQCNPFRFARTRYEEISSAYSAAAKIRSSAKWAQHWGGHFGAGRRSCILRTVYNPAEPTPSRKDTWLCMELGALVQGVILLGIQRFARERFGADFWRVIEADVNITGRLYLPAQSYPMSEVDAVIGSVSRHSGMSVPLVLESIGDYVAPDMLGVYSSLIDPQWNLLDVLLHSELIVEQAALKHGTKLANTPVQGRAGSNGEMVLVYRSPWRMCQFIKGLVRGLGAHMDQPVNIDEVRCTSTGSPACEFAIKVERTRPPRQRLGSVPERSGQSKSNHGEIPNRPSSPPLSSSFRSDTKSTPGLPAPRIDTLTRRTNFPPPIDSDIDSADLDLFGNRRR